MTTWPALSRRSIAEATTSRGASSASACSSSMKRAPSSSSRWAPSPRSASDSRKPSRGEPARRPVGWNWTNSRSEIRAPARQARAIPSPVAQGGLVVTAYSAPAPPVARTVAPGVEAAQLVVAEGPGAADAAVLGGQREHRGVLEHPDPGLGPGPGDQLLGDPGAGGAAADVQDAAPRVATLEPERGPAALVEVEAHAEPPQIPDALDAVAAPGRARRPRRTARARPAGCPAGAARGRRRARSPRPRRPGRAPSSRSAASPSSPGPRARPARLLAARSRGRTARPRSPTRHAGRSWSPRVHRAPVWLRSGRTAPSAGTFQSTAQRGAARASA